jgi:hypothetical protein
MDGTPASTAPTASTAAARGPIAERLAQTMRVREQLQRDFQKVVTSTHTNDWTQGLAKCLMEGINDLPARTRSALLADPGLVASMLAEHIDPEAEIKRKALVAGFASKGEAPQGTNPVPTLDSTMFQGLFTHIVAEQCKTPESSSTESSSAESSGGKKKNK